VILRVVAGVMGGTEPRLERGLIRAHLGADRSSGELVEVTVWEDRDAARWVGPGEVEPAYFDIGATWLEWSRDEPVAFRVAVRTFTQPGAEVEMLAALRERMPLLGEDLTESAVGRRLAGPVEEIIFFSAWAREPAGGRLDRLVWPDASLHDGELTVRVCSPTRPIVSATPSGISRRPGP
jgi:hypothetical protein